MRGNEKCITSLLKNTNLTTPIFNIDPKHLKAVKRLFEPIEPPDKMTIGKITTFLTMKTTAQTATPIIKHNIQQLTKKNAQALAELLGADIQRAQDLLKGVGYGIFKRSRLVASAASPEILDGLAIIRGVHTAPDERGKGYATSVCSALVQQLTKEGKDVMLYVSKDNPPALKVYKKIGFKETGHKFLSYIAQRKQNRPNKSPKKTKMFTPSNMETHLKRRSNRTQNTNPNKNKT
jgi:ribosomal protein S18 acetylase RimI-like enzyme